MPKLHANDYKDALGSQTVCNLSGIVFSFARVMQRICDDTNGSDERNNHAICRLYAEQIAFLTSSKGYSEAHNECEQLSQPKTVDGGIVIGG